jgi:hypothetical protein
MNIWRKLFCLLVTSPILDRKLLATKSEVRNQLADVTVKIDRLNAAITEHLRTRLPNA